LPVVSSAAGLNPYPVGLFFYNCADGGDPLPFTQNAFPQIPETLANLSSIYIGELPIFHDYRILRDGGHSEIVGKQALPAFDFIIKPSPDNIGMRFWSDLRPQNKPFPESQPFSPWVLTKSNAVTRLVIFTVSLSTQIQNQTFDPQNHTVELRGQFSNWNPIPGWFLPTDSSGSTQGSTKYMFFVNISGNFNSDLSYKYFSTSPALGWESFSGDRTLTLGPAGVDQVLREDYFNQEPKFLFLGNLYPEKFYVGNSLVKKLHLGANQVYP
jgi:hypothetical protein